MQFPVLIEPQPEGTFRAVIGEPFSLTADGATHEEALQRLQTQVTERLAGRELAMLDVPLKANPWQDGFGMFRDEPLFDDWQTAIEEYRRERDEEATAAVTEMDTPPLGINDLGFTDRSREAFERRLREITGQHVYWEVPTTPNSANTPTMVRAVVRGGKWQFGRIMLRVEPLGGRGERLVDISKLHPAPPLHPVPPGEQRWEG